MEKKWTDSLRERMQDYREPGPEGLWAKVSDALDAETKERGAMARWPLPGAKGAAQGRNRKAAGYFALGLSAAAAIFFALYLGLSGSQSQPAPTVADILPDKWQDSPGVEPVDEKRGGVEVTETETILPEEEAPVQTFLAEETPVAAADTAAATAPSSQEMKKESGQTEVKSFQPWTEEKSPVRKKRFSRFSAALSYANVPGSSSSYMGYSGLAKAAAFSTRQNLSTESESQGGVMLKSSYSENAASTTTDISHRQPVRVGVSFRYNFTKRWGIETGLTYSLLSSTISSATGDYSYRAGQSLHYIGVPLHISYDFLQRRWFSLYATAGGMFEKCISGRLEADYMTGGTVTGHASEKISQRPVQWSVNAAAGAQVSFSPLVGLYIEPGVSWFFNDGSTLPTIYKDRPLNFNLEFGLRFSF